MDKKQKEYEMKIPATIEEDLIKIAVEEYNIKAERTDFGCKLKGEKDELVKVKKFIVDTINQKLENFENRKTNISEDIA